QGINGALDQFQSLPVIAYTSEPALSHANPRPQRTCPPGSDFRTAAYPGQTVATPLTGQLAVTGTFSKPVTSDDVMVKVLQNQSVVFQQQLPGGQAANVPLNLSLAVNAADPLRFLLSSDSTVAWSPLSF